MGDVPARKKRLEEREKAVAERRDYLKQAVTNNNAKLAEVERETPKLEKAVLAAAEKILVLSDHRSRAAADRLYQELAGRESPRPSIDREQAREAGNEAVECDGHITELKLQIEQMNALEPGEKCPCCLSEIKDLKTVVARRAKKRRFLENQLKEKEALSKELESSIAKCRNAVGDAMSASVDMQRAEARLKSLNEDRQKATEANQICQEEFAGLSKEWKQLQEERKMLEGADDAEALRRKTEKAQEVVEAKKAELTTARKKVMALGVEYGNLEGHAEDLKRRMSERETLLAKKPGIVKEHEVHKRLVKAFSKDGVPAIIMENVTEDLRNYANEVLRSICSEPMMIDFVTQSRTEAGSWVETFDITVSGGERSNDEFRDLSGGEQVRVSIALRLALSKILMRRVGSNIKFLLLDEVDQALDRQGIQALADTLRNLSRKFKVMVITHNDSMKDMFDHIITVRKGSAGSTMRQAAA
jgi:exonuclease SbcC